MRPRRSPALQALRHRPVPTWWTDAKLGIFVHWTPASIPAFAPTDVEVTDVLAADGPAPLAGIPYAEWYLSSLQYPDSAVARHHREHYGDRPYEAFADDFRAALPQWDPDDWADRFARAGAAYVVLVTKHADGFCLWPSEVANPHRDGWNAGRDLVGELATAVRARGLRFGVYYSGGLDWTFLPRPQGSPADVLAAVPHDEAYADYAEAQVRELVDRYRPSVLWNDIAWPFGGERLWRLFADYYDAVPDGVVNDRWHPYRRAWDLVDTGPGRRAFNAATRRATREGRPAPRPPHFDHLTPEYTTFDHVPDRPWECCRGIDRSFAYNRASGPEDHVGRDDLLGSLADIVAKGGNLLLNVGPRGEDTAVPEEQQRRLDWLGEWLTVAGPALRATRPWVVPAATGPDGHDLRFTSRGEDVHVLVLDGPREAVTVDVVEPGPLGSVTRADGAAVAWARREGGGVTVDLGDLPADHPWPLALTVHGAVAVGVGIAR